MVGFLCHSASLSEAHQVLAKPINLVFCCISNEMCQVTKRSFPRMPRGHIFLEPNNDRLVRRLKAVVGERLRPAEVEQLAAGDLSLVDQLAVPARQAVLTLVDPSTGMLGQLERMVGATLDYLGIAFLEQALRASASVVRLIDLSRRPIGTGVMISDRLLLTNNHVIPDAQQARAQLAQFNYQLAPDGSERVTTEFTLDPETLLVTSPVAQFDFTIVCLGARVMGSKNLAEFGHASLSAAPDKHAVGDFVTLIQHPMGDYKQIALRENRVIGRGQKGVTLYYAADTLGGSSGSPVYNDQFDLIALHHSGGPLNDTVLDDGRPVPPVSNEGIRISAIVKHLRDVTDTLTGTQRQLLVQALDAPATIPVRPLETNAVKPITNPPPIPTDAESWTRLLLPVHVLIGRSDPTTSELKLDSGIPAASQHSPERAPIKLKADSAQPIRHTTFAEAPRHGYSSTFLDKAVPLPRLTPSAWSAAAVPINPTATDGVELRYLHFSLMQDATRRVPFFAAVNIHAGYGRNKVACDPAVPGESAWIQDPRLRGDDQLDPNLLLDLPLKRLCAGHFVRPKDAAWGHPRLVSIATDDTFHLTNCCLRHIDFAQGADLWLGLERYLLASGKAIGNRLSVFIGPVFAEVGLTRRDIPIPTAFWKVIIWSDVSGPLRASGFLADQSKLVSALTGGAIPNQDRKLFDSVVQSQVPLAQIERLTSVTFGPLVAYDTCVDMEAGAPMTTYDTIVW
jgi:endonuclease G